MEDILPDSSPDILCLHVLLTATNFAGDSQNVTNDKTSYNNFENQTC